MNSIFIKKIAENPGGLPAIPAQEHIPGTNQEFGFSMPIGYSIEGVIKTGFRIGKELIVNRTKRNEIDCPGMFITSTITEITDTHFKTSNSVYEYNLL